MPKSLEDLENEMRILKNEVQQALLDIREFLLTYVENPFAPGIQREQSPSAKPLSSLSQGANGFSAKEQPTVAPVSSGSEPSSSSPAPSSPEPLGDASASPSVSPGTGYSPATGAPVAQTVSISLGKQDTSGAQAVSPGPNEAGTSSTKPDRPSPAEKGEGEPGLLRQETPSRAVDNDAKSGEERQHLFEHSPDLATIALLAPWVENGLRKVGRPALETVFNLYADLGGALPPVRKAMTYLLALSGDGVAPPSAKPSLRQCLRLLADLDALLQRAYRDKHGAALLAAYLGNWAEDDKA